MRVLDPIEPGKWRLVWHGAFVVMFFVAGLSGDLRAQDAPAVSVSNPQDAPGASGAIRTVGSEALQPQSTASVAGTVRDMHGAGLSGAHVRLVSQDNTAIREAMADSQGNFTFADLTPGAYRVTIDAAGFEPFASSTVVLGTGETRELPAVTMQITNKTTVNVVATVKDVAQAQVKQEEKQRILGFLPNYYTSYIWDAVPMTPKLKFRLALRTTTDPVTFLVVAGVAGVEQAHNTFPGYGQGMTGYAKRFGASYADTVSARMFGSAIFPALLHQDPRYFYQGSGSTRSRLLYAIVSTLVCRGDNGRLEPNYSHVLGSFAAAGLSNLYRAPQDRQANLTFRNGLIIVANGAVVNVLREFLSRELTSSVPAFANGKPQQVQGDPQGPPKR